MRKAPLSALTVRVIVFLIFGVLSGSFVRKAEQPVFSYPEEPTVLFAHRGITGYYPENSLESLAEAKRLGFQAVEFDIRKSAEGTFILFHDVDGNRMLDIDLAINRIPDALLAQTPLLVNGKRTTSYVPTLKKILDQFSGDFTIYLDMKLSGFKEADQIAAIIREYRIQNSTIVASADILFILYLEREYPDINTALEGFNSGKEWTYNLIPEDMKPDFLSGFLSGVDNGHVKWLRNKGLLNKRIVYGVNSSNYQAARSLGLKNMILDFDTLSPEFSNWVRISLMQEY